MQNFTNHLKLHVGSLKTVDTYVNVVKNFFNSYKEFNQNNVNAFLTSFVTNDKKSYFNLAIASLNHYATFVKTEIDFPKSKKISRGNFTSLTKDEIEKEILPYFPELFRDGKKRETVFRFMLLTMMRIGEVASLKTNDIDFETMEIKVRRGKGDKDRIVFLHDSIKTEVQDMVSQSKSELAFDITKNYITYMFQVINQQLNYKKHITPHTTRHAGAKFMVENNMTVDNLQDLLGHQSLDTTKLYIKTSVDEIHEVFKKIKYKKGV